MVAILFAGGLAYRLLPVSALPQVDYPTIQVLTFYPGASPDVMASSVTAPLERQFGQMPGLNQMTSTSSSGSSVIVLQFTLNLRPDVDHIAAAAGRGSRGHPARPENLGALGRRAGQHQRRAAASGADASQPDCAGRLWLDPRGPASGDRGRQRQPGQGQLRRPSTGLGDRRERPAPLQPRSARHTPEL